MWSHAGDRLLSTIFGGDRRKRVDAGAREIGARRRKGGAERRKSASDERGSSETEAANRSTHQQPDRNNNDPERNSQIPDGTRIQNSLSSSSGDGIGGSSSGYTSQQSNGGGGAAISTANHHFRDDAGGGGDDDEHDTTCVVLNGGDRNNNLIGHDRHLRQHHTAAGRMAIGAAIHEQMYHSLASSTSHLARQPMVPMMIDDEEAANGLRHHDCDGGDGGDDDDDDDDEEQTLDFDLNDEDLAKDRPPNQRHHDHHLHHHQHQWQSQGLRLIDGLRRQHEMRYRVGGDQHQARLHSHEDHHQHQRNHYRHRQHHHLQLDDKLSLANSIMFQDHGSTATPPTRGHFSLPPADTTTTTSRGTTLLACGEFDGGGECAIGPDEASISSAHFHANHHRLAAYEAADLRPRLREAAGGATATPHLTYRHHFQEQPGEPHRHRLYQGSSLSGHQSTAAAPAAIYHQPNLVNELKSSQLLLGHQPPRDHQSRTANLTSGNQRPLIGADSSKARSSSFLQFQTAKSQAPLPPHSKPEVFVYHHRHHSRNQEAQSAPFQHQNHALHGGQKLEASQTAANISASGDRLASNRGLHPMTNRMRPARADVGSQYLAAPDTSDSSHSANKPRHQQHQQVRRSRSNQQLSVSPTGQGRSGVSKSNSASAHSMAADAPTTLVAASQINANLAAISAAGGNGRRSAPLNAEAAPALGCCGKLAKFLLFIANILFWSAGIALGAWGILALVEDHKNNLSQLLVFDSSTRMSLFQLLAWSFITLGCATILVGVCGCSAMFKNSRWILGLYIFLILAIFALDLATGLLAMIFQERLVANVRLRLVSKLRNEYGLQASFTAAIDYIQTRYECCGLDGHFDYDQSLWRLQRLGGFEATVARTCCHLRNTFDDQAHVNPRPVNESMCQSTDVRFHQSYRYRRGCLDDLERLIRHKIWTFTIGCGIVGGIILLSLALATCFCRSIPSSRTGGKPKKPSASGAASRHSSNRVHQQALAYAENVSKKQGYHSSPQYR